MATFITALIIILGGVSAMIAYSIMQRRKNDRYIRSSYGQARDDAEDIKDRFGLIEQLYLTESDDIPEEELIDDITWDDLGMDDVFAAADHTDCCAGEQYLYSRLHRPFAAGADSAAFEERTAFFDGDEEKRFTVRKKLSAFGKNVSDYDIPLISLGMKALKIKTAPLAAILFTTLTISAAAALITGKAEFITLFAANYLVNIAVHFVLKRKADAAVKMVFGIGRMLNTADSVCKAAPEKGVPEKLSPLSGAMRISSLLESKTSNDTSGDPSLLFAYLLAPFMADILLGAVLLSKLSDKSSEILDIYRFLGRTDAAIAVGSYRKSLGICCKAERTGSDGFSFGGLVHPLLKKPVPNDITFERNIIVTGSNASGKSTFIKAVAVNLLLGQTVNTCTARTAVIPECGIITSMAVRDDVISGESYYIREIRYLRRMVELCGKGRLLFLAVDEILKGTNTAERIAASKAILEYLGKRRCMLMTATHDLELAESFSESCDNIHFSEDLTDDDVKFDYILRQGISTSTNAIKLLGVTGFPADIISRAEEYKSSAQ